MFCQKETPTTAGSGTQSGRQSVPAVPKSGTCVLVPASSTDVERGGQANASSALPSAENSHGYRARSQCVSGHGHGLVPHRIIF